MIVHFSNKIASKSLAINPLIPWFYQKSPANHDVGPKLDSTVGVNPFRGTDF